ncbi:hypothetical protein BDV93DRAFT_524315 [Ceratobasidium sp. AG-I]|nr:hypothetical protein BDV93DRAFT_524315 [Ceratobasidium sp. AG-I]
MPIRRRFVDVLPLPGVGEIERFVKGVIDSIKAAGYENEQCESLVQRLSGLIAIVNTCKEHENFVEILNQLQDVKARFEVKLNCKPRLSAILRAQDRLRAYDDFQRELTDLMEKAQLQLSANILVENREESSKRSIERNIEVLRECDLSFDDTESPTWIPSPRIWYISKPGSSSQESGGRANKALTHTASKRSGCCWSDEKV